jgi:hypothetical protein
MFLSKNFLVKKKHENMRCHNATANYFEPKVPSSRPGVHSASNRNENQKQKKKRFWVV